MVDRAPEDHPATATCAPRGAHDEQLGVSPVGFRDDLGSGAPPASEAHDRPDVVALNQRPRVIQQGVRLVLLHA